MSISLDGFITGPNNGVEQPLADGGERLHEWVYGLASWRERQGHRFRHVLTTAHRLE